MSEKVCDNNQIVYDEPDGEPTCSIIFENNPKRVYYTGQIVNGCVQLAINNPTVVRAIYASIVGRGYCKWTEGSGRRSHSRAYTKEEFYFSRKIYFVGSHNSKPGSATVDSGDYIYSFECNIPDECPTSLEEDKGFVRYSVTVVIEEDEDRKKEFVESFTVLNPLNLNDDETNGYPMSDEAEFIFTKYCCCLCCWLSEPVKISAKVPRKGYAPGEPIEITINVDNKSNETYDNFEGNVFKTVEFYANDRTNSSTDKLATFSCEGCKAGEQVARKLIVTVPPTARTEKSDICSISYELRVQSFVGCCEDDLKFVFPLIVGTYPMQNTSTQTAGGLVVTEQPTKMVSNISEHSKGGESQNMGVPISAPPLHEKYSAASSSEEKQNLIEPDFQLGESHRSDKDLANSYRPMYPMYTKTQYPLALAITVEAGDVKPLKM